MSRYLLAAIAVLGGPALSLGQTVSYEASSGLFPEQTGTGWYQLPSNSDRWLSDGWLVQYSEIAPNGAEEADTYRRNLPEQADLPTWFLQFRIITDTPPVYSDVGPAAVSAGGHTGVGYDFIIGDSQVRFLRDVSLPYVYTNIQPGVPHTYRLELRGAQSYSLWIDSVLIDSGVPEGPYPVTSSFVVFRGQASDPVNTTMWRYVRFGRIPVDYTGDFDSNGLVDGNDLYFFCDCLLAAEYDSAGPSCRWADMNADGKADGADIQLFVNAMMAG